MPVETVDAAPLTFDFSNSGTRGPRKVHAHHDTFQDPHDIGLDDSDSLSLDIFDSDDENDEDNAAILQTHIPQADLKQYLDLLGDRTSLTIPPVQKNGLPPLEIMNIPNYDGEQLKSSPTEQQQKVLRLDALRGPKYLISYAENRLNFRLPKKHDGVLHHKSASRRRARSFASSSASTVNSTDTSIESPPARNSSNSNSNHSNNKHNNSNEHVPPLPPLPTKMHSSNVFHRLRNKVSSMRSTSATEVPPSPVVSDHEHEPLRHPMSPPPQMPIVHHRGSFSGPPSNYGSLSPTSTFSSAGSVGTGQAPLIQSSRQGRHSMSRSSSSQQQMNVPPVPSSERLAPTTTHNSTKSKARISRLKKVGKSKKDDSDHDPLSIVPKIKKSHKYLANVGTLRIRGSRKVRFDVVVDPRFPFSFIDMDAVMTETARAGHRDLLGMAFHVLATPVYRPESRDNRVVIDIELIPISDSKEDIVATRWARQPDDGFSQGWYNNSKRVIGLMDIRPYKCILGRDWLAQLDTEATRAMAANEAFLASIAPPASQKK